MVVRKKRKRFPNWKRYGRVVVFIDAANLENSVKDLGWWVDYKKLYQFFNKHANLVDIRHYCARFKDTKQDGFFTVLKHAGFTLVTKPLKIIKDEDIAKGDVRKANFDVEITIDALQMRESFDTLVLFSGDSDFDALVQVLRKKKKKVVVISTKHHISRELIASANKYLDLRKFRAFIERKRTKKK